MGNERVAPESFLVRKTRRGVHIGIGALIGMRVLVEWGHLLTKIRGGCLLERGSDKNEGSKSNYSGSSFSCSLSDIYSFYQIIVLFTSKYTSNSSISIIC